MISFLTVLAVVEGIIGLLMIIRGIEMLVTGNTDI